jgi:hypothetical protein
MNSRRKHPPAIAGAKAGFSTATAYRFEKDPRLPSQKKTRRERRRADPLAEVWDSDVVPLLKDAPSLRPIAIFEELCRRHPDLSAGTRRTLERMFPLFGEHGPGVTGCIYFTFLRCGSFFLVATRAGASGSAVGMAMLAASNNRRTSSRGLGT